MYHSLIKPCLFRAKWDMLMRTNWINNNCACYVVLVFLYFALKNSKNAIYFDNMPVSVDRLI